jgi:hypothetical protein
VGGGNYRENVNEGEYGGMCFAFIYENRIMKRVEIVIRRGKRGKREIER